MSDTVTAGADALAFAAAHACVDSLLDLDLTGAHDDALLAGLRELERVRNRLAAVEHALVSELDGRDVHGQFGCASTTHLLQHALRLTRGQARGRVSAAAAAGPRRALTGEALGAVFPAVAAAQSAGELSPVHAAQIVRTVERLDHEITAVHGEAIEASLVEAAASLNSADHARACEHLRQCYDPDGTLPDEARQQRNRGIEVTRRADGSARVLADLTPECAEAFAVVADTLARPRPATDGTPDPRSAAQRLHDAFHDLCLFAIRSETLPACGGVAATIVLTMTTEAWLSGEGVAWTGHGFALPAERAKRMAAGDCRIVTVAINSIGAVEAYGSTHRLFYETQRLALHARDGGCSFPGCDAPAAWCQADHIIPFSRGGERQSRTGICCAGSTTAGKTVKAPAAGRSNSATGDPPGYRHRGSTKTANPAGTTSTDRSFGSSDVDAPCNSGSVAASSGEQQRESGGEQQRRGRERAVDVHTGVGRCRVHRVGPGRGSCGSACRG